MKSIILATAVLVGVAINSISGWSGNNLVDEPRPSINTVDMAAPIAALQEQDVVPQDPPPPPAEDSPLDIPAESSVMDPAPDVPPVALPPAALVQPAVVTPCGGCCCQPCCCPVPTRFCLVDPCDGCSYDICVHLTPCCAGLAPRVDWKYGVLGRKVAWLYWPCCDKHVKVVDPIIGGIRVWE